MDSKAILIALMTAALGAACLFVYMKKFEAETSGGDKVPVLIATRDLKMGEKLDKNALGVRQLPQAYLEQRHIPVAELEEVIGAQLSMTVHAGEAVLWSDLASMQAERRDLSGLIEPGMRAVSLLSKTGAMFGGLLRPGDRVDVVFSPGDKLSGAQGPTVTLLQNVLVLAIGSDLGGGDSKAKSARAVTLSLTPEQAQLVIHAVGEGQLDVALRNPEDIVVLKDLPETTSSDIREPERRARFARRPLSAPPLAAQATAQNTQEGAPRAIDQVR